MFVGLGIGFRAIVCDFCLKECFVVLFLDLCLCSDRCGWIFECCDGYEVFLDIEDRLNFVIADVCIVGVARTPMGGLSGSLSSFSATKLGSIAIQGRFL